MMEINLWNVDEQSGKVGCKTRQVIAYIERLEPRPYWDYEKIEKFDKIKRVALNHINADRMLEIIGYNFKGLDSIYEGDQPPRARVRMERRPQS